LQKVCSGKKGYPKFKKNCRCVEYKTSGWKLSEDRRSVNFIDKKGIGKLKLKGTRDLHFYQLEQIKRVRLVRRADGYYVQFLIKVEGEKVDIQPTGRLLGWMWGLRSSIPTAMVILNLTQVLSDWEKRLKYGSVVFLGSRKARPTEKSY
jgi:putative transposase